MNEVRIGCSGWNYSDWRGDFYPPGVPASRWLRHYASVFDTVEVNATFYRLPERKTTQAWVDQVPEDFLFAVKASFRRDDETLAAALEALPPAQHCFEFRHPSWFSPEVRALLEEHGASLALGDDARRALPDASPLGPIAYLRLHCGRRGRDGNYSDRELDSWRRRIAAWRSRRPVCAYLNNDWRGFAPRNAAKLRAGLS